MPCKKSEIVSAINSYAAARATNDGNLINFGASAVSAMLDTLEFDEEEQTEEIKD